MLALIVGNCVTMAERPTRIRRLGIADGPPHDGIADARRQRRGWVSPLETVSPQEPSKRCLGGAALRTAWAATRVCYARLSTRPVRMSAHVVCTLARAHACTCTHVWPHACAHAVGDKVVADKAVLMPIFERPGRACVRACCARRSSLVADAAMGPEHTHISYGILVMAY